MALDFPFSIWALYVTGVTRGSVPAVRQAQLA